MTDVDWDHLAQLVRRKVALANTKRHLWKMELVVTDSYSKRKREELRPATGPDDATLVGSKAEDGMYYPVLDFDFPCRLYESETEGHYHFFVDKGMTWDDYKFLLQALHAAGLIEDGFLQSALQLEDTFVATKPWKGKK